MDWMLLGLHRVLTGSGTVSGRTSALGRSSEVWEFLYAFVNRATGNFTAANSQYDRRVAQSSILAPALSDLLPMASGEEVDVAGLPGVRARIVSRQDAERLCEKWSRAASRFFQREHGTPAHFCLLERVSPGGE
jgi:hypothetical protein